MAIYTTYKSEASASFSAVRLASGTNLPACYGLLFPTLPGQVLATSQAKSSPPHAGHGG
eukprot:CAMPEP_0177790270 /NCGR_PEP_ID=MMETSP0491_2-20121128/23247_1 /TAXON_ID=63592 /ORGANISM="Tetraselmis chuii, Strain PLY429" /LENGTH=58 /DNA_ID=CAMNT_0019312297 /DNA_START=14 /DNA_END=187 /DNA_ORIENTATION=-